MLCHVCTVQNKPAVDFNLPGRQSKGAKHSVHDQMLLLQVRRTLRASVKDIIRKVGVTSILVTHDQEEAFDIADKVVIFNRWVTYSLPL